MHHLIKYFHSHFESNLLYTVHFLQEIPQQKNGSDCGVFACKYADYIAKGRPLTFKQVNSAGSPNAVFFYIGFFLNIYKH